MSISEPNLQILYRKSKRTKVKSSIYAYVLDVCPLRKWQKAGLGIQILKNVYLYL